jgi:hypothetical protein
MQIRGSKRWRRYQLDNAIDDMGRPPTKADQLKKDWRRIMSKESDINDNEIEGVPDQYLDVGESEFDINEEGVRADGTVEDCDVETYYHPVQAIELALDLDCIRVFLDDRAVDIETRIPLSALRALGFKTP